MEKLRQMKTIVRPFILSIFAASLLVTLSLLAKAEMSPRVKDITAQIESQYQLSKDPTFAYFLASIYAQNNLVEESLKWLSVLYQSKWNQGVELLDFEPVSQNPEIAKVIENLNNRIKNISVSKVAFSLDIEKLFPESIAYAADSNTFYIGSLYLGKIFALNDSGQVSAFFTNQDIELGAISGMKYDSQTKLLWVLSNPATTPFIQGKNSQVLAIDVESKKIIRRISSADKSSSVLNDLCILGKNLYVTDSQQHQVYKLTPESDHLVPLKFLDEIKYPNGITCDDQMNTLYVADYLGVSEITLKDHAVKRLKTKSNTKLGGIDGLYLVGGKLIAIQNALGMARVIQISELNSELVKMEVLDNSHKSFDIPTTGVIIGHQFYYIANSQMGKMAGNTPPKIETTILKFEIGGRVE